MSRNMIRYKEVIKGKRGVLVIAYIKGELAEAGEDFIVVECPSGVAYHIRVPASILPALPSLGSQVKINTYLHVREDAVQLFGFLTRDDLKVFQLLIGVNGIGPKGALSVLSVITPDDLRFAVLSEDVKTISKVPGIGNKTAQRIIIELKDKMKLEDVLTKAAPAEVTGIAASGTGEAKSEAVLALTALGYSNAEALKAVNQVEGAGDMDTEALLKAALRKLALF